MSGFVFAVILTFFPGQEVNATQMNRYALAISEVVQTEPLPFDGRRAKEKSAALLVALAYRESGLRESIERCEFKPLPGMTEDDGRAIGLPQLVSDYARGGHDRQEICGNAELQFRLALRYLTRSMRKCKTLDGILSDYNSNRCEPSIYSSFVGNAYARTLKKFGIR